MPSRKVSPDLAACASESAGADEPVEAVIELKPQAAPPSARRSRLSLAPQSRKERIAAMRDAFEERARDVAAAVEKAGGEVVEKAWINQTLRVRLPREGIDAVAELDEVSRLDAPRRVTPEPADRPPSGRAGPRPDRSR